MKNEISKFILILTAVFTLLACDPGSGGGIGGSGIRDTDISVGVITGFGSVVINEKRFDTSNALIISSGNTSLESDLRVGMIVNSSVDFETLTADRIEYLPQVVGPVTRVSGSSFEVLGLTVELTANVNLDGIALEDIAIGTALEVSGWVNNAGTILATFIRVAVTDQYLARGLTIDPMNLVGISNDILDQLSIDIGTLINVDQSVLISLPLGATQAPSVLYTAPELVFVVGNEVDVAGHVEGDMQVDQFSIGYFDVVLTDQTIITSANGSVLGREIITPNSLVAVQGTVFSTNEIVLAERIVVLTR